MSRPDDDRARWRAFVTLAVASAGGLLALVLAAIVVVDPHDHLFLSPPLARAPINANQRFSYPAIARDPSFDSLVVGTSTGRLLRPAALDRALGGRFANLSMNSATAWEQSRILDLFARHHRGMRALVVAVDSEWCNRGEEYRRYTFREFPEWMYDDDGWNDLLHLLNGETLEQTIRQIQHLAGRREPRYGFDGFDDFLPPASEYDLARARGHIYGARGPHPRPRVDPPLEVSEPARQAWRFPTHPLLAAMLAQVPAAALKVLVFVPYHVYSQPTPGSEPAAILDECKRRITEIAGTVANGHVLDFMIESPITTRDENYWDRLHFSVEVADRVVRLVGEGVRDRRGVDGAFVYLGGSASRAPTRRPAS